MVVDDAYLLKTAAEYIRMLATMIKEQYKPNLGYDGAYGATTQQAVYDLLRAIDKRLEKAT